MAFALKPGSRIRFEGELDINATPPYSKMILTLTICDARGETTAVGNVQDGARALACDAVDILSTDTADDIATKIKAEVDAQIAAG